MQKLKMCKKCGAQMDISAKACPRCGAPAKSNAGLIIVGVVAALIIITATACSSGDTNVSTSSQTATVTSSETPSQTSGGASEEESKAESAEESKEESKEKSKAESKEESKAESKEESKAESKEESKAESIEESKAESKEESKSAESEQTETVKIESSVTATQLYKDFFEPYTDSMGKIDYNGFSTVEKLKDYRVENNPGSEEELCTYKIYSENGDYIYMCFYPLNIEDNPESWIKALSLLCYEGSDGKEISVSDNYHVGNKLRYNTFDPNRNTRNVEVNSVDELVAFMFGQ